MSKGRHITKIGDGRPRCGYSGKIRYATEDAASGALAYWRHRGNSQRVQPRCVFCDGFHLTKSTRG